MLKNPASMVRLTARSLVLLLAAAAIPLTIAFAAQPPQPEKRGNADGAKSAALPAVQTRAVNKLVKDFPEKVDLSTPESALAAFHRAIARRDVQAVCDLSWQKFSPGQREGFKRLLTRGFKGRPLACRLRERRDP